MKKDEIRFVYERKVNTSTISDILDSLGVDAALNEKIGSINRGDHYFAGFAYTVEWARVRKGADILASQESTWEQVKRFLVPEISDGAGLVYVAGAGPVLTSAALAGAMSCTYFDRLGFEGVVLGGAVRDIPELRELKLPVLASNPVPVDTQGGYRVAGTGGSCVIDNRTVHTGDLIISDSSGTVVVPSALIDTVLERAWKTDEVENEMLRQIRSGSRLPQLVEERRRI
ncbi:RraA family protein [Trinickia terrae]|uniref:Putative 4-hydroxy-4-methyl-2-oxoglutarate aldolase n=1 Tax=Trinickia terrae TaxID=2571161 RepID=A0A4U1HZE7_9BURK|nr:RraA family protein [Trinickia terrae]TKC86267.1 RraA family protein [Trinickia terrae]